MMTFRSSTSSYRRGIVLHIILTWASCLAYLCRRQPRPVPGVSKSMTPTSFFVSQLNRVLSRIKLAPTPLIVPDYQMESLKIICAADMDNTIVSLTEVPKFEKGQLVRVVDGAFKGVIGIVARWQGQQRVGVVVEGLVTMVTAYVPSAFLEEIIQ